MFTHRAASASIALLASLVLVPCAAAQQLLIDINTVQDLRLGSSPRDPIAGATRTFFWADTPASGLELWSSDGTSLGTRRVTDGWPGPADTAFQEVVVAGDDVYFSFLNEESRPELWIAPSSGQPPVRLFAWPERTRGLLLAALGTRLVFRGWDAACGYEPWITDGTPANTHRIADLFPGVGSSLAETDHAVDLDGIVYFTACDAATDYELWRTDGTAAGSWRVADVQPGVQGSSPTELFAHAGEVWFAAAPVATGRELYRSDGSAAGTRLVADVEPGAVGSDPIRFVSVGARLFFEARTSRYGDEIWSSDGTPAGTSIAADVRAGASSGGPFRDGMPRVMAALGNQLVFRGGGGFGNIEPWITDGNPATARLLADLQPGSAGSVPYSFLTVGNEVWFVAVSADTGAEVYRTDGTSQGTGRVTDLAPGPGYGAHGLLGVHAGRVLFNGDDGVTGQELWSSDGSSSGTHLVADLAVSRQTRSSDPAFEPNAPGLFSASRGQALGTWLWRTDGTPSGTFALTGLGASFVPHASLRTGRWIGDRAWIVGDHTQFGREPWVTDGTPEGTRCLDLLPGDSYPHGFIPLGGSVLFAVGQHGSAYSGLWKSDDHTGSTTYLLANIGFVGPRIVRFRDRLYFAATGAQIRSDSEPWVSDGTAAGTYRLLEIHPTSHSSPAEWTRLGEVLLFAATDAMHGRELWVTDGTASGTRMLVDLRPEDISPGFPASSAPERFVRIGPRVLFWANDGQVGTELWATDGTVAGTTRLADIAPGGFSPALGAGMVAAGPRAYFALDDREHGNELWTSDGTPAGTYLVKDIRPGALDSIPHSAAESIAPVGTGGSVVFAARGPDGELETWISDGTEVGTRRLFDLRAEGESAPVRFTVAGRKVLFAAEDGVHGVEPWAFDVGDLGVPLASNYGDPCGRGLVAPEIGAFSQPRLGSSLVVTLSEAPPRADAALLFGFTPARQQLGRCTILVTDPQVAFAVRSDAAGEGWVPLPIPAMPEMLGREVDFQWAVTDPGGPVLGVVALSDGLQVLLGR